MGYMRSYQGDYMRSYVGDPGLFGFIGKLAGKILRKTPIGRAATAVGILKPPGPPGFGGIPPPPRGLGQVPVGPGTQVPVRFNPRAIAPGGQPFITAQGCAPTGYHFAKDGSGRLVRNRRMNVANVHALRRATRRQKGFVKLAKRSLPPGYKIVTSSSRRAHK